ncbi:MAG: phosphate/phosphite/phosphonate ABC transporter substrate-binding protein [Novosphingobium sp.]
MHETMKLLRRLGATMLAAALLPLAACSSQKEEPLRVGMIPDAGATQVSIDEKAPLQSYLSDKLGRPVELVIPTNYNATVEAIGNGSLDIAYFGGLTYVKAHERYGAVPLVQREIDRQFHSLFIAHAGSGIAKLADLKGKTFCFGDINSTSGHLMPRLILKDAGLPADTAFKEFRHTGSHPATAQAVASGACDAGALDETVFRQLVEEGKVPADKVTVFYTSPPFTDYVWAARKDLSAEDREAFSQALLALRPGQDNAILEILRGEKFVPADNASYADVEQVAKELDLL